MKTNCIQRLVCLAVCLAAIPPARLLAAPAPAFTYQGFLGSSGAPADGLHFFSFRIFAAASGGSALATFTPAAALTVDQGYFSVVIDHSSVPTLFADGQVKYLEIQVKKNSGDAFTTLTPRQPIYPSPMAQNIPNYTGNNNTFTGTNAFNGAFTTFAGPVQLNGANTMLNVKSDQAGIGDFNGTNAGGTWLTLRNQRSILDPNDNEQQWNLIATGAGNGEGPRKLLFRDGTAGAVRMTIDGQGDVGIGTTDPKAKLEVVTGGTHSLRFTDDIIPTIESADTNLNEGLRGYMRLKNVVEIHPRSDGSAPGKLDVRDTSGNPTITLDGGNGTIAAANLPAVGGVQTGNSSRGGGVTDLGHQESRTVDIYSLTAPATGTLMINASIQAVVSAGGTIYFKLMLGPDNGAQQLVERDASSSNSNSRMDAVIPITWLLPVTAGQQVRLFTSVYNQNSNDSAGYYGHSLTALFVPKSL